MISITKTSLALCLSLAATSVSAATIENGSFEDFDTGALNNNGWTFFTSIPGWDGEPNLEIQSAQTIGAVDAKDGDYYAELDTNQDASISQAIQFATGQYKLSFYYSPRVNDPQTSTNNLTFSLDNGNTVLTSGSVDNAPNPQYPWGEWIKVTSVFSVATAGEYTLTLSAAGGSKYKGCGNCGALVDHVTLETVPLPASALLLLAGIGGIGALRARRG